MKKIFSVGKTFILSLVLLSMVFSFVPNTALAFSEAINAKKICAVTKSYPEHVVVTGPVATVVPAQTVTIEDKENCMKYYVAFVIAWAGSGIVNLFQSLANTTSSFFKASLTVNNFSITRESEILGSVFYGAWKIVRNWANILIVLGFIGVALAFMMNLDQYKKLLVPLLLVAVLLNFSVVIVGFIIDLSNIIMKQFVEGAGKNGDMLFNINKTWNKTLYSYPINTVYDAWVYFGLSIVIAIAYFMLAITFFALGVIFIERLAFLAILFIFSPLAFVFYAFPLPGTKDLFKKWWETFIKWAFVGIIGIFFLDLTSKIVGQFGNAFNFAITNDPNKITALNGTLFVYLFIVIVFLYIGMKMTFKAAGLASGIVIGAAAATGTLLAAKGLSLAAGAGKVAGRVTGVTPATQRIGELARNKVTQLGEKYLPTFTGLRKGSANLAAGKRLEQQMADSKVKDRMETLSSKDRIDMANQFKFNKALPYDPKKISETAGLVKTMVDKGDFGKLAFEKQKELAAFTNKYAPSVVSRKDFSEVDPRHARDDKNLVLEEKKKLVGKINRKTGLVYHADDMKDDKTGIQFQDMQEDAEQEAMKVAYRKINVTKRRELNKDAITLDLVENTTEKALRETLKDMSSDRVDKLAELPAEANAKLRALAPKITAARMAGNTTLRDALTKDAKALMKTIDKLKAVL